MSPPKVLVVDDEPAMRMLIGAVLTGAGIKVADAETGEEGLEKVIEEGDFDLLILDKNLPGMDGLELLRQARERFPRLLAILMTALPTEASKAEAFSLGVYRYISKPFENLDDLADMVKRAIREGQASVAAVG